MLVVQERTITQTSINFRKCWSWCHVWTKRCRITSPCFTFVTLQEEKLWTIKAISYIPV